jgi:hypothetical protein
VVYVKTKPIHGPRPSASTQPGSPR